MKIGELDVSKIMLGSDEVEKVYLGTEQVYGGSAPPVQTHYISGTSTASQDFTIKINLQNETVSVDANTGDWEITYSGSITSISAMCKSNMSITSVDLTGINYPYIDKEAFQYCSNLSAVTIPEGITVLSGGSFTADWSLVDLHLPSTVTAIGNNVFGNCSGLTAITIDAMTPPTLGTNTFYNTNNCPINVPCGAYEDYYSASTWASYVGRLDEQPCPDPIDNGDDIE